MTDNATNPAHYQGKIQPLDAIEEWSQHWPREIAIHLGHIVRYAGRCGRKDSPRFELEKIATYATRALARLKLAATEAAELVDVAAIVAAKPREGWYGRHDEQVYGPFDTTDEIPQRIADARGYGAGMEFSPEIYHVNAEGTIDVA